MGQADILRREVLRSVEDECSGGVGVLQCAESRMRPEGVDERV
jgi:hypothetical protein